MELTKKHKNFRFFITYTKVEKNPEFGFVGRLDKDKLTAMIRNTNDNNINLKKKNYFVCGSSDFFEGIKKILIDMGVDPKKIKTQGY